MFSVVSPLPETEKAPNEYFLMKNEYISTVVLVYNVKISIHVSVVNAQELFTGKDVLLVKFGVL